MARSAIHLARLVAFAFLLFALDPIAGPAALPVSALLLMPSIWGAAVVHEVGHAIAALSVGGVVPLIAVRPLMVRFGPFRVEWIGRRRYRPWLPGGRTEYRFARRHGTRYAIVAAGGATADVVVAVCLTTRSGSSVAPLAAATSCLCAGDAVASLLSYPGSDGASLAKLRRMSAIASLRLPPPARSPKSGA